MFREPLGKRRVHTASKKEVGWSFALGGIRARAIAVEKVVQLLLLVGWVLGDCSLYGIYNTILSAWPLDCGWLTGESR